MISGEAGIDNCGKGLIADLVKEGTEFGILRVQERSLWPKHLYLWIACNAQFLDQLDDVFRVEKHCVRKLVLRYFHRVFLPCARGQASFSCGIIH